MNFLFHEFFLLVEGKVEFGGKWNREMGKEEKFPFFSSKYKREVIKQEWPNG